MSHTLLFELGTEELPPSELPSVLVALEEGAMRLFMDAHLAHGGMIVMATHQTVHVSSPVRFLRLPV